MSENALIEVSGLTAGYGNIEILHEVGLVAEPGSICAVIGPNGAGKTTLAKSLAGFTRTFAGEIRFDGEDISDWDPARRARGGIASVPEGRRLFPDLSVRHNLDLAFLARGRSLSAAHKAKVIAEAYSRFPVLAERERQRAGSLSGGEQQMLAIARALALEPKLLVLDEPSTGLAPKIVAQIFESIADIAKHTGCCCLLIEQQALTALEVASFAYVLDRGSFVSAETSEALLADPDLYERYLGQGKRDDAGAGSAAGAGPGPRP